MIFIFGKDSETNQNLKQNIIKTSVVRNSGAFSYTRMKVNDFVSAETRQWKE